MERYRFCIVIPAFNEETTIKNVVLDSLRHCQPIVIDDASSDNTAAIAKKNGAIVVVHKFNQGYEGALNSGFKIASQNGYDVIITLDGDGQHDSKYIEIFISGILNGNDMVLGVRNKFFRVSEYIFSYYSKFKFNITDPCCGMKAYKTELYENLGFFDKYNSVGTELAFNSVINNCKFSEIPIKIKSRKDFSRYGTILSGNLKILKAIFFSFLRYK